MRAVLPLSRLGALAALLLLLWPWLLLGALLGDALGKAGSCRV
jgi:hypothetical protein